MLKLPPPSRDFNEQMGGRSLGDMSINASPGMSQCEARQSRSSALPWLSLNLCNGTKGFLKLFFHWAALEITLSFHSFHFWRILNLNNIVQCKPRHVTMWSAAKLILAKGWACRAFRACGIYNFDILLLFWQHRTERLFSLVFVNYEAGPFWPGDWRMNSSCIVC